jgi:hypothetical protein
MCWVRVLLFHVAPTTCLRAPSAVELKISPFVHLFLFVLNKTMGRAQLGRSNTAVLSNQQPSAPVSLQNGTTSAQCLRGHTSYQTLRLLYNGSDFSLFGQAGSDVICDACIRLDEPAEAQTKDSDAEDEEGFGEEPPATPSAAKQKKRRRRSRSESGDATAQKGSQTSEYNSVFYAAALLPPSSLCVPEFHPDCPQTIRGTCRYSGLIIR